MESSMGDVKVLSGGFFHSQDQNTHPLQSVFHTGKNIKRSVHLDGKGQKSFSMLERNSTFQQTASTSHILWPTFLNFKCCGQFAE